MKEDELKDLLDKSRAQHKRKTILLTLIPIIAAIVGAYFVYSAFLDRTNNVQSHLEATNDQLEIDSLERILNDEIDTLSIDVQNTDIKAIDSIAISEFAKSEIRILLTKYFVFEKNREVDSILSLYSDNIERYHQAYSVDKERIRNEYEKSWKKYPNQQKSQINMYFEKGKTNEVWVDLKYKRSNREEAKPKWINIQFDIDRKIKSVRSYTQPQTEYHRGRKSTERSIEKANR